MTVASRLSILAALLVLALGMALAAEAQETAAEAPAAETEATAVAPAEAASDEGAAEEATPALSATLTDPATPMDELKLRLIPLTADELTQLANRWLILAQDATEAVIDKQISANAAEGDAQAALKEELTTLRDERRAVFGRYTEVVDALERKGGAAEAVAGYRAYRNAIFLDETQAADWRTLMQQALDWMTDRDGGIALAIMVGAIAAALLALLIVARIVRGFTSMWLRRVPNLSKLLQTFLAMVAFWLTIAFGLMIVLSALGVNITPLFALVGGASFIMAFAMQDTLGNLAAGLMIMINRPFDAGDYVDIAGTAGTVKSVSIVSTKVTTPDNQVIVVPNSKVWGNVITNVTASATRRVDLVFGIGYGDKIEEAQQVLEETVRAHPLVMKEPEPVIRVNQLGASSVDFVCRPWVRSSDYWTVYWDLTRQVKENFDRAGISIPFPQTDMHIHMSSDAPSPFLPPAPRAEAENATETVGDTPAERYAAGEDAADEQSR